MKYQHTNRKGFLIGFLDFFTAGLFLLVWMPRGLQRELEEVLGHRLQPYATAYLLGIPTSFIYTLVWMAKVSEELRDRALALGVGGSLTSFRHMFCWNVFGLAVLVGPMVATRRFFDTLNRVEEKLNLSTSG